jgi:macrodomain Ter protein organizer (MatP/YcbG family)
MAKALFKIENIKDVSIIHHWMKRQFDDVDFLDHFECTLQFQAKEDFKAIKWNDCEKLNEFSETYLKKADWKKMKNALRSARFRNSKRYDAHDGIKRVDITRSAHNKLSKLSLHYGVTQSEIIEKYMKKPYEKVIEDK